MSSASASPIEPSRNDVFLASRNARAVENDLTFDALTSSYNFNTGYDRRDLLVKFVVDELPSRGGRALDIGCGNGISTGYDAVDLLRKLREHCDDLWGIEPDPNVNPTHGLLTNFQHAALETADLPAEYFDVAYSYMVVEHVTDPLAFLKAAWRVLKPGGSLIFLTVNGQHYFTLTATALKKLRIDELALRLWKHDVEDYHYPVQYRCNTPAQINRAAAATGFELPQFVFEETGGPTPYFKGPLRPLLYLMNAKRLAWQNPTCLMNLYCRMRKSRT